MRIFIAGLFFAFVLNVSTESMAQLSGDTFAKAKASKTANIVYTFSNTPGFIIADGPNSYSGICVDIIIRFETYVKAKYGITIKAKYQPVANDHFSKMLTSVKSAQGGVFGLGNITITEARKKVYNFSPPFINNISLLVTNKKAPALQKIDDLASVFKGMTGYAVKGSTNEIKLLKWKKAYFPDMKITYVNSIPDAVKEMETNEKAFTNVDFAYYLNAVKEKKPIKRHLAGASNSEEFGILMPKSNDWEPILADFLNSGFIGSAEYDAIIHKHLGESAVKLLNSVK